MAKITEREQNCKAAIVAATAAIVATAGGVAAVTLRSDAAEIKRDLSVSVPEYEKEKIAGWVDVDNDGCATRYDVLERDLISGRVRCRYVAKQVRIKTKYGLAVTENEREKMREVLEGCDVE